MLSRGRQLAFHVLPAVIKPLRVVWNQIIGFLFLVLGLWTVPSLYRAWREFDGDAESIVHTVLPAFFSIVMLYFAFSSFRRARKASR